MPALLADPPISISRSERTGRTFHGLLLPFKLPSFDRRRKPTAQKAVAAPGRTPRTAGKIPVIGQFDIDTQFRILGTVFLISLLISIATIFMQGTRPPRHQPLSVCRKPHLAIDTRI